MSIPAGWKLVPEEPTDEQLLASKGALKAFIDALPPEAKVAGESYGGYWLHPRTKAQLRYRAMVSAAPTPPQLNAAKPQIQEK